MSGRLIEEDLFTKYSIIDSRTPEGQKINSFLSARAKALAGKYIDFDKTPVTFVLSDSDQPNAFYAPAPDPDPDKKPRRDDYKTIRFHNEPSGYLDSTVLGNITVKTTPTVDFMTTAAYAIISHGEDGLGAVELNYDSVLSHKWCVGGTDLKSLNCNVAGAVVANATRNNGKDAGVNYFDDMLRAGGKPKLIVDAAGNLYCWGGNGSGQIGDNTTTQRNVPTRVTLPTGVNFFTKVSANYNHSCAIGNNGLAYCWGDNGSGQIGKGL